MWSHFPVTAQASFHPFCARRKASSQLQLRPTGCQVPVSYRDLVDSEWKLPERPVQPMPLKMQTMGRNSTTIRWLSCSCLAQACPKAVSAREESTRVRSQILSYDLFVTLFSGASMVDGDRLGLQHPTLPARLDHGCRHFWIGHPVISGPWSGCA